MGYKYLSWGDLSREIERGEGKYSEFQAIVSEIHRKNLPFPKNFVTNILRKELEEIGKLDGIKVIIDGYPKRLEEAIELDNLITDLGFELEMVVKFNLDFDTYQKRLRTRSEYDNFSDTDLQSQYDRYMVESIDAFNLIGSNAKYIFELNAGDNETQVFGSLINKINQKYTSKYHLFEKVVTTKLQTEFGVFDFSAFQNKVNYDTHLMLSIGEIKGKRRVPTRVHSSCITGDIFHSFRCDCMEQLHHALRSIGNDKFGILIYLFQEGRGINIINKIKAYNLQQAGRDTVDANTDLGLPAELRKYDVVKDILDDAGVKSIDLMTNNPDKISKLQDVGVVIENRIPIIIKPGKFNRRYLQEKKQKMQHIL